MSEQNSSDDSYRGEITSLRRVIEQLRLNLYSMEEQAALFGPLDTPLHLKNAIEETNKLLSYKETRLRELLTGAPGKRPENVELKRFWEPFLCEGAKFFVSHTAPGDAPDRKIKVTALTMQGVINMYRLLTEQFFDSFENGRIRLDVGGVLKSDTKLERLVASDYPHLIVIGAPGSHPLSNYLMAQFKGIPPYGKDTLVRQGYVFRVSGDYQGSPFIVSDEGLKRYPESERAAMQELGIYDLKPNHTPRYFPRTFGQYDVPGHKDEDCAIILTGWVSLPGENRIRRVVLIAGHSAHSTLFGTAFVATNEDWARQVNALNYYNTETVIGLQIEASTEPVAPSILAEPREIYKQFPRID